MLDFVSQSLEKDSLLTICIVKYSMEARAAGLDITAYDKKLKALEKDFPINM